MEPKTLNTTEFPALGSRRAQRLSEQLQAIFEAYVSLPENLKRNALVGLYSNGQVSLNLFGPDPVHQDCLLAEFSRETIEHEVSTTDLKWSAFVAEMKQALDILGWNLTLYGVAIKIIEDWKIQNEPGYGGVD